MIGFKIYDDVGELSFIILSLQKTGLMVKTIRKKTADVQDGLRDDITIQRG